MSSPKTAGKRAARRLAAQELFDYAVKYLAMRACSTDELRWKLRLKAARAEDIDPTIDRLRDIGYLDDQRFAESYAAARAEGEGFGKERVLRDLRTRRVPGNLAQEAVAQVFEGKTEAGMIEAFIERRMPSVANQGPIEDQRDLAAAYRKLRRAGFGSGAILKALKGRVARPEILDEAPPEEEDEGGAL